LFLIYNFIQKFFFIIMYFRKMYTNIIHIFSRTVRGRRVAREHLISTRPFWHRGRARKDERWTSWPIMRSDDGGYDDDKTQLKFDGINDPVGYREEKRYIIVKWNLYNALIKNTNSSCAPKVERIQKFY